MGLCALPDITAGLHYRGMSKTRAEHLLEQEEAAQGQDLFRAPGAAHLAEEAQDQAEASGWISDDAVDWPAVETKDQVARRRRDLYEAMRRLEAAVARPSGLADWRIEIEAALTDLDRSLQDHIAQIEGPDGLFVEILNQAPHLEPIVETLRKEHRGLAEACHDALGRAADWSPQRLRRRVNVLVVRLALHRQTGAELLFDAYNVDIAGGD